ncbi:MAG: histidine ammonia-lyase [Alphaproteobacteria bacterium]|nr:histidine ammonia-lyase [Alphaproteobacteria bacterium]
METITLRPGHVTLDALRLIARTPARIAVDPASRADVEAGADAVARIVASGHAAYGINTGFGRLAQTRIPPERVKELQRNLVLSHATGTGPLLDDSIVRVILALKAVSLARGLSGVRWTVIERLVACCNAGVLPEIPGKGSVGASGDLAPLAHVAAALIGVGKARVDGRSVPAAAALAAAGIAPLDLGPKEGLALLNGTQVSTALAVHGLLAAEDCFAGAIVAGALTVDAIKGSDGPFDARIHAARGHPGQVAVAAALRRLTHGSAIRESHVDCTKVQDPYSARCQPQVMGAVLDSMRHAAGVLAIEASAVSDNPLVFPDTGEVVSGGNFHAEPVGLAADALAVAIAEIGALSERRIAMLTDASVSGLPPFLVAEGGVNSGFMIAHVTAAALASENKVLAHPASVDSLPTSANQEDHVSMATFAARRLGDMADNVAAIVGIELLAAVQGIEFHRPMRSSAILEDAIGLMRNRVARWDRDRFFAPDIASAKELVAAGEFRRFCDELLPSRATAR